MNRPINRLELAAGKLRCRDLTTWLPMFPRRDVNAMAVAADSAIDNVLIRGARPMISPPHKEVDYVAAVTLGGIRDIARAWKPICSGLGLAIRLAGVFCHAAPIVTFKGTSGRMRCELADLLVVTDVKQRGSLIRRAALIQAKMARAKQRVSLSGPSSRMQLDLYQNWHRFDFEDPAYDMKRVNFKVGPQPALSGTFGAIDPRFDCQPHWTQHLARPTPSIIHNNAPQLGRFIAEMADGTQHGFGRLATPSLKTDWSKAVERLLTVTYARAFGDKAILGPARPPRGANAVACLSTKTMSDQKSKFWQVAGLQPPYDGVTVREDGGEPSGLSVVHIELATN